MRLRIGDVVRGELNWTYEPARNKTTHRGKRRVIPLGPKARALLADHAGDDRAACVLSPADAEAEQHAAQRTSKRTPWERAKRIARPGPCHAERYNRNTCGNAADHASRTAFPSRPFRRSGRGSGPTRSEP